MAHPPDRASVHTPAPAAEPAPPPAPPQSGWSKVDLHLHTTASDGRLTPAEVVALALQRGLRCISITDHDSTEGVDAALEAARGSGLEVIPGTEMNTDTPRGEAHMLGYLLDHRSGALQSRLAQRRHERMVRGEKMVARLHDIGLPVEWERVQEIAGADEGGAVGRPHVARAMVERGYVATTQEAFDKYIGRDGPAYVEYEKLTPEEAIGIIRRAGGVPVLAHPSFIENLAGFLPPLVEAGLAGLECYYGAYSPATVTELLAVARRFGLVATGGSDYHGSEVTAFNATIGGTHVPLRVVDALKARHATLGTAG